MPVHKDAKTNTWRAVYRFTDWTGERKQTQKRGFATRREAQAWEREMLNQKTADVDMTFASFIELYTEDVKSRMKENTWHTKEHIIRTKLLPYFGKRKLSEITPRDIMAWQNAMIGRRDEKGKPFSPVYLKTLHNQMNCIKGRCCTSRWKMTMRGCKSACRRCSAWMAVTISTSQRKPRRSARG